MCETKANMSVNIPGKIDDLSCNVHKTLGINEYGSIIF